jgi:endonuclease/exonuclease/phosphatase family metal-dependent hydrolase
MAARRAAAAAAWSAILLAFGPWLGQAPPAAFAPATPLRVVSYNAQFLPGLLQARNRRPDPDYRAREIARRLARCQVIGLQELFDSRAQRRLLEELHRAWGGLPTRLVSSRPGGWRTSGGLALVSRLPLVASGELTYVSVPGELISDRLAAKGVLHARLRRSESAPAADVIDVFVTHLESRDDEIKHQQILELADFVGSRRAAGAPALILGDFNVDGRGAECGRPQPLYRHLVDALAKANGGRPPDDAGFWSGGTKDQLAVVDRSKRLDYVLLLPPPRGGPDLTAQRTRVDPLRDPRVQALSDHSAVISDLRWTLPRPPSVRPATHARANVR